MKTLRITEIFYSLQGESNSVGWPTVFIRLTGCPLRCQYCDTAYAFHGGNKQDISTILQKVAEFSPQTALSDSLEADLEATAGSSGGSTTLPFALDPAVKPRDDRSDLSGLRGQSTYVTVTGGEPLAQPACLDLLSALCDAGYTVSLETSGALSVAKVDARVIKVIDLKTPGSKEVERNDWSNLSYLQSQDQIKFVICDRADYEWAKKIIQDKSLTQKNTVLFSASHQQLPPQQLADWVIADRLPVRFQLQMHKYIWGDIPGK